MLKKRRFKKEGVVKVSFDLPSDLQADTVHLVGDFTDWQGTPMARQKSGVWRTTVDLEPNREYEFRYLVDGSRWVNDEAADAYVANPFGEENSVVRT
jgi:1,4-alpha-glucan branching enzyme